MSLFWWTWALFTVVRWRQTERDEEGHSRFHAWKIDASPYAWQKSRGEGVTESSLVACKTWKMKSRYSGWRKEYQVFRFTVALKMCPDTVGSGGSLSEQRKWKKGGYRRSPPSERKINMVFWEERCHSRHILQKMKEKIVKEIKSLVRETRFGGGGDSTPTRNNKKQDINEGKRGKQENHTTALILNRKTQCIIGFRLVNQCNHWIVGGTINLRMKWRR